MVNTFSCIDSGTVAPWDPGKAPTREKLQVPGSGWGLPARKICHNTAPVIHSSSSCSPDEEARRKQSFPVHFQFFLEYFLCVPRGSKFSPVSFPRITSALKALKASFFHTSINGQVGFESFYFNLHFLLL